MTTFKRISILLMIVIFAAAVLGAQSRNTNEERTVEESYLQEAIELMIIREISQAQSLDQKLLALEYIGEAIDRGNTGNEIRETLEFLSMEGVTIQARENGRMVNNFPLARREAAKYLGKISSPEAQTALINMCRYEPEPMVIQEAIKALGDCANENAEQALQAIVFIVGRFNVLNPDNMMALAAVDAIAKIADRNGIRDSGALILLLNIADGPYIRPVKDKARTVLNDLRKANARQNVNNK